MRRKAVEIRAHIKEDLCGEQPFVADSLITSSRRRRVEGNERCRGKTGGHTESESLRSAKGDVLRHAMLRSRRSGVGLRYIVDDIAAVPADFPFIARRR